MSWARGLLVVSALALISVGGFWFARTRLVGGRDNLGLDVDPKYLDFGEVWVQDSFSWVLPIKNTTPDQIEVAPLQASCACVSIEPPKLILAPNETAEVQLILDLTPGSGDDPMLALRDFDIEVGATVKGAELYRVGWRVRGRVKTPVGLAQWSINFGEVVHGVAHQEKSILITPLLPGAELKAECQAPFATAKIEPDPDGSDTSRLKVILQEGLPLGEFSFPVEITAVGSSGQSPHPVTLRVSGKTVGDIQFIPTTIAFEPAPMGDELQQTVVLSSRSGKPFVVEAVASDSPHVSVERITDSPVTGAMFRVVGRAAAAGDHWANINFTIRSGESRQPMRYPLPVYCYGLRAERPKESSRKSSPD